jgi:ankyrin repeat protein
MSYAIFDIAGNQQMVTNLWEAAEKGDLVVLGKFMRTKMRRDLESLDKYGRTPLMWACDGGHADCVDYLIQAGANIKTAERQTGRTALHWAARNGSEETVRILVEAGSDIHHPDRYGLTPLYLAMQRGQQLDSPGAAKCLLEMGAKLSGNEIPVAPPEADELVEREPEPALHTEESSMFPSLEDVEAGESVKVEPVPEGVENE